MQEFSFSASRFNSSVIFPAVFHSVYGTKRIGPVLRSYHICRKGPCRFKPGFFKHPDHPCMIYCHIGGNTVCPPGFEQLGLKLFDCLSAVSSACIFIRRSTYQDSICLTKAFSRSLSKTGLFSGMPKNWKTYGSFTMSSGVVSSWPLAASSNTFSLFALPSDNNNLSKRDVEIWRFISLTDQPDRSHSFS